MEINIEVKEIIKNNIKDIKFLLTPKEYKILLKWLIDNGKIVNKFDDLHEAAWISAQAVAYSNVRARYHY